jgi:hypothetical protein
MKIVIRRYDVKNTSEIPAINRPSLQPIVSETIFDNAEIIIHTQGESQAGMIFEADGLLVLDEIMDYSRDVTQIKHGYSVSGTFLSTGENLREFVLKQKMDVTHAKP